MKIHYINLCKLILYFVLPAISLGPLPIDRRGDIELNFKMLDKVRMDNESSVEIENLDNTKQMARTEIDVPRHDLLRTLAIAFESTDSQRSSLDKQDMPCVEMEGEERGKDRTQCRQAGFNPSKEFPKIPKTPPAPGPVTNFEVRIQEDVPPTTTGGTTASGVTMSGVTIK